MFSNINKLKKESHMIVTILGGSVDKNLPTMRETPVLFLGLEDHLEKERETHSSTCWENPMEEGPGGLQFRQWQELDMT